MVFSSLPFLFRFLPLFLAVYFIVPAKLRNAVLFLASLIFYAWGEPVYVLLMLFSTVVDYVNGILVDTFINKNNKPAAKAAVGLSVVINLGLLCFFKYSDFILSNVNSLIGTSIPLPNVALPIGISFYTFQTMSYTIDVYRRQASVQKNIISFGAYVAMFPQLIAGPIVQYKQVAAELQSRSHTLDGFAGGVRRFSIGLAKKVLLANNIGALWNDISLLEPSSLPIGTAWLGAIAFALQIYFDFSGYSDMAIGLGSILGFRFPENFNHPYQSLSITEFWRRWHISLGSWFREYVYIPLGGNRRGIARQLRNISIVWLLTGLWHGASWNFIAWGAYFGVLLIMEKLFMLKLLERMPKAVRSLYTLVLVLVSWAIFAFDDISAGLAYIGAMFGAGAGVGNTHTLYILTSYGLLIALGALFSTELPSRLAGRLTKVREGASAVIPTIAECAAVALVLILSTAALVNASYNPFLYFRF